MGNMVGFLEKCHAYVILEAYEATSVKNKRKIAKKHSERMAKKFKASRETLDTYAVEPRADVIATSARTASGKIVPSEAHLLSTDNSSSILSAILSYNVPYVLEPILSKPIHTSAP